MSKIDTVPADGGSSPEGGSQPQPAGRAATGNLLVGKLVEIMQEVERIPKRGHNDFHNYDYATESDITGAIRQGLASRGLMILPRVTGRQIVEKTSEKGGLLAYVDMTFCVMDAESGEALEFPWLGCGEDKGDKAIYKAFTGALKYFLLKLFLIPTGDDPERDDTKKDKAKKNARQEPPADDLPPAPPSGDAAAILDLADALSQKLGKSTDTIIREASEFTTDDGKKKSFTDPTSVRSAKWLAGVRRKLEDAHRDKVVKAEVTEPIPF